MSRHANISTEAGAARTQRELRETRDMLATVIRASPLAIIVLNRQREVMLWNDAAQTLFGWSEAEVLGEPLPIIPESYREEIEAGITASLQGESGRVMDGKRLHKDGHLVEVQGWVGPHCNESGEVIGAVGMFADASERHRQREAQQQQQEELARVLRFQTVSEVATTLAHELNQPLCAILNYAGVALDQINDDRCEMDFAREMFSEIVRETNRANQIIRKVRRFVGKRTADVVLLNINEAVRDAVNLIESRTERSGVELTIEADRDLPLVRGDGVHVVQIIVNLINNAIDAVAHVPRDFRRVTVKTVRATDTAADVRVIDRGPGMASSDIERAFEPFYTTKADGLGMGLAISRSLAEMHGGQLHAEKGLPGGMVFILTLPLAPEKANVS